MKPSAAPYIHILAFQCPACERPIVEWVLSTLKSPESIDSSTISLKCSCGWSGGWLGAQARRHVVLAWPSSNEPSSEPEDPPGDLLDVQRTMEENQVEETGGGEYTEHFIAMGPAIQLLSDFQLHHRRGDTY